MSNDHINCCDGCRGRYCASKVPIFENLEENELSKIVQSIDHRQYIKGELLFDEGSTANNMFFINEGKIKLYKYTKEGKEQILHILSEGEFFGELNLVKSSIHNFNAKAIKNSKI
ncbi:cyclic nucleotide-binding domain-containing protein, partial [Clostridium sp.]|uniref:Crp/Fnr family transcriptional regulator n=1 Tax=Clostridium sp. TaxID=1506 RepID=UPI002A91B793